MNNAFEESLVILVECLNSNINFFLFGSVAIAVHKGEIYREIKDIDVIIDAEKDSLKAILTSCNLTYYKKEDRGGRKRMYGDVHGIEVEYMFTEGDDFIILPNSRHYYINNTELVNFCSLSIPAIGLPALLEAKRMYEVFLKMRIQQGVNNLQGKLDNMLLDMKVIEELLGGTDKSDGK